MKFILFCFLLFSSIGIDAQMLTSVYFMHNSSELNDESKKKLDSLAELKTNLTFRVFGNCDLSGSTEYNKVLSENRANTVSEYLKKKIGNNIKLESTSGLGEEKQINDNSTEELRGKNRRVDLFIEQEFDRGQEISQMKVKEIFSLPNLNFIGNRHIWLPNGNESLNQLFRIMKDNPTLEIELQGHICCDYENFDGKDIDLGTFNLSWTRANSIKEFLQNQGIDSGRIKAIGLGHLNPLIYPERTENDRIKNRRVEVVLLKK
ncbi:OmpA family protein [Chryseobacterium limigenitum]|nr:OmpA family protein [Chryseobacterium limigenitum]